MNDVINVGTENGGVMPRRDGMWIRTTVVGFVWVRLFNEHLHVECPVRRWGRKMKVTIQPAGCGFVKYLSEGHGV